MLYRFSDSALLQYAQYLQSTSDLVIRDPLYTAPIRDPGDLMVLQTAERGRAQLLCIHDRDFWDDAVVSYCAMRGIEVCDDATALARLRRT